jgi:transcriptional regulator with XRE-family HTH domain
MPLNNVKIGEYITQLRKSGGLTQNEVAEKLQITYQAVSKWERGETLPDVSLLPELARILETSVDGILSPNGKERKKILEDVQMGFSLTSYASAAYGCLKAAGFWQDDMIRFMGMTGLAFRFVMREDTCPSSPTVYNWVTEHTMMMDRIGVHSDCYLASTNMHPNTQSKIQASAVRRIRETIDRGVAVVAWAPSPMYEFGIINGYDDESRSYYVRDCTGRQEALLPYDKFGISEIPELFYQIFHEKRPVDAEKAGLESLRYALGEWNKEYYPYAKYGSGRKAYEKLIAAVEKDDLNVFGLAYNLKVYSFSKRCAAEHLKYLTGYAAFGDLDGAAELYGQVAAHYEKMAGLLPYGSCKEAFNTSKTELLESIRDSLALEEESMRLIGQNVAEGTALVTSPSNPG